MNIEAAKTEIKRTLALYLEKDEMGNYLMPQVKQRPLLPTIRGRVQWVFPL